MIKISIFLFLLSFLSQINIWGQVQNNGNIFIGKNSFVYVDSLEITLGSNGSIQTDRTDSLGQLRIASRGMLNSSLLSNHQFVDGYLEQMISTSRIFPIGQNQMYAPIEISTGKSGYFGAMVSLNDPTVDIGSTIDTNISDISSLMYWYIKGDNAQFKIAWNTSNSLTDISIDNTDLLKICGYNSINKTWEVLSSSIDSVSFLGGISNLQEGSISVLGDVDLKSFTAFTLCKVKECKKSTSPVLLSNQFFQNSSRLKDVKFESGKMIWYESYQDAQLRTNALSDTINLQANKNYYVVNIEYTCPSEIVSFSFQITTANLLIIQSDSFITSFPNPTDGLFEIKTLFPFDSYQIQNELGRVVESGDFITTFNIRHLKNGVYTLVLTNRTTQIQLRIVKIN